MRSHQHKMARITSGCAAINQVRREHHDLARDRQRPGIQLPAGWDLRRCEEPRAHFPCLSLLLCRRNVGRGSASSNYAPFSTLFLVVSSPKSGRVSAPFKPHFIFLCLSSLCFQLLKARAFLPSRDGAPPTAAALRARLSRSATGQEARHMGGRAPGAWDDQLAGGGEGNTQLISTSSCSSCSSSCSCSSSTFSSIKTSILLLRLRLRLRLRLLRLRLLLLLLLRLLLLRLLLLLLLLRHATAQEGNAPLTCRSGWHSLNCSCCSSSLIRCSPLRRPGPGAGVVGHGRHDGLPGDHHGGAQRRPVRERNTPHFTSKKKRLEHSFSIQKAFIFTAFHCLSLCSHRL